MRVIIYYLLLLIFIALLAGFLIQSDSDNMSMEKVLSVCALLAVYVVAMSLVGEGQTSDERDVQHRYIANRAALIAGTIVLSSAVFYQLFTHQLDYWLLGGLITINLVKIISLIYTNYKN